MTDVLLFVLILLGLPSFLLLGTFVARDMDRRGLDGRLYGLLMLVPPIGVAVWAFQHFSKPALPPEQAAAIEQARMSGPRSRQ